MNRVYILQILKYTFQKFIDDINSESCSISDDLLYRCINIARTIANPNEKLTKKLASEYLNVSVSTFEVYIKNGWIPEGKTLDSYQKTKYWELFDLQDFVLNTKLQY